jgi:hypothetical protein
MRGVGDDELRPAHGRADRAHGDLALAAALAALASGLPSVSLPSSLTS